jgi:hypothetical protein
VAAGVVRSRVIRDFRTILRLIRHPAAAPLLAVALYIMMRQMPPYTSLHSTFVYKIFYGGTRTDVWLALDNEGHVLRVPDFDDSDGVVYCHVWPVVRFSGFAFDLSGTIDHTIAVIRMEDCGPGWPAHWTKPQIDEARNIVADAVLAEGRPQRAADFVRRGDGRTIVVDEPAHIANGAFFALAGAFAISCLWLPAHCWRLSRFLVKAG